MTPVSRAWISTQPETEGTDTDGAKEEKSCHCLAEGKPSPETGIGVRLRLSVCLLFLSLSHISGNIPKLPETTAQVPETLPPPRASPGGEEDRAIARVLTHPTSQTGALGGIEGLSEGRWLGATVVPEPRRLCGVTAPVDPAGHSKARH